jgi:hypothetical protein
VTEMWQDDDFFSMRDEDWDSYRRRVMRDEAADAGYSFQDYWGVPESPQIAPRPPKGVYPTREPRIDRECSSQPYSELEADLDFPVSCEKCSLQAAWYVEVHWPNFCTHPSMDAGRLCQLVCSEHLKAYERRADKMVAEANPPWWVKLFREPKPNCTSCGKPIQTQGDIIRVVRAA